VITFTRIVTSEMETCTLAASLAQLCVMGDCILLYGKVGAGKTAFARGFIRALGGDALEVVSPTFTLVQTYPVSPEKTVWHYDLYRLKHITELEEIGLIEALQTGITLIEWPEFARAEAPVDTLSITLQPGANSSERVIEMSTASAEWEKRLRTIKGLKA
jgi:tRNA threonylcarbamoyl adenosine modification protein YjeE